MDIVLIFFFTGWIGKLISAFLLILFLFIIFSKEGHQSGWWIVLPIGNMFLITEYINAKRWLFWLAIISEMIILATRAPLPILKMYGAGNPFYNTILIIGSLVHAYMFFMLFITIANNYSKSKLWGVVMFIFTLPTTMYFAFFLSLEKHSGIVDKPKKIVPGARFRG